MYAVELALSVCLRCLRVESVWLQGRSHFALLCRMQGLTNMKTFLWRESNGAGFCSGAGLHIVQPHLDREPAKAAKPQRRQKRQTAKAGQSGQQPGTEEVHQPTRKGLKTHHAHLQKPQSFQSRLNTYIHGVHKTRCFPKHERFSLAKNHRDEVCDAVGAWKPGGAHTAAEGCRRMLHRG